MKKVLALFLALFRVIGCLPLSTFATELSTGGTLPASPSLYFTDSAETEESDQPTDQETQDENRGEEE